MSVKEEFFTVNESAKVLNVTRQTVYRWIKDGIIKAETIGRETLIEKTEIWRYKNRRINDWLYEAFNNDLERTNYKILRDLFGYLKTDTFERMGDYTVNSYCVIRKTKEAEILTVNNITVSFNKKTSQILFKIDEKDIMRELATAFQKRLEQEQKENTKGE